MPLESKDKVKYTYNQFMACYANSFFVLSTNIDYVVYIIKNDTDQRYDRGHRLIRICLTVVCF